MLVILLVSFQFDLWILRLTNNAFERARIKIEIPNKDYSVTKLIEDFFELESNFDPKFGSNFLIYFGKILLLQKLRLLPINSNSSMSNVNFKYTALE